MEQPLPTIERSTVRCATEAHAMAIAIQANLVQLRVADAKSRGMPVSEHEIEVVSPGAVRRFRETLIYRHTIQTYSTMALRLRMHEVWGQFCLMQWLFSMNQVDGPGNFGELPTEATMRCAATIKVKEAEVHAVLWRFRFEQRKRRDADYVRSTSFAADDRVAGTIPAILFGKKIEDGSDEEILLGACEHVGMLAVLRWILNPAWTWGSPELMEVRTQPF